MDMKMDEELGLGGEMEGGEKQQDNEESGEEEEEEGEGEEEEAEEASLVDGNHMSWPRSYKQSMDLFATLKPFNDDVLERTSFTANSSSSSLFRRQNTSSFNQAVCVSLLSNSNFRNEDFPSPRKPSEKISYQELSPNQECSFTQAVLNGFNVLCGLGMLSIPLAVKGGWTSLFILFLFGVISCYTGILLMRCLDSSPEVQTYPDIGRAAFGNIGRLAVSVILYAELYASCVEYITLMSDNISYVFPDVDLYFCGIYLDSNHIFSILAALTVLPTVWLKNLSLLSYLSAGGVIASLMVALCLFWVGTVDHIGFHPNGTALDLSNIPISIGLYAVCFAGHAVFPNIYTSMKKPSQFPGVLIVCFATCWLLYTAVAVCGFLMFGDSVESQFTLNMPHQFVASKIAVWTMVVNPLTKYALTITPVALCLEELLPSPQLGSYYVSLIIRTVLVLSTLVVALTVPFFDLVMALIGSFSTMLVALIFPCACYLKILHGRLSLLDIGVCTLIILVGMVCCCIGSYSAITKIFAKF